MDTFDKVCVTAVFVGLLLVSIAQIARVDGLRDKLKVADTAHGILSQELKDTKAELADLESRFDGFVKEYNAVASWYGPGFHGKRAADGSVYDQMAYTAAHRTLPFGTIVIFEANGHRVPAIITDRGPFIKGRDFDLSKGLADRLGLVKAGVAAVAVYELAIR